jgi:hypothetical protein
MSIVPKHLLFLLLAFVFLCETPASAIPLQGGVSEDIIHAVPDQYRPGQYFDPDSLEKSQVDHWVPVPAWAAGRWTRNMELIQYPDGNQITRQMTSSTSWGSQVDVNNTVWHCYPLPSVGVGEGGGERCYSIWLTQNYDSPRADMLRYSGEGMSITVDARTGIIKQVVQSRATKTLTPNPDGTITSRSSESAYDEQGHRTIAFKGMTQYFKTGPFVPRPEMRESLYKYLQSNGLGSFIPQKVK